MQDFARLQEAGWKSCKVIILDGVNDVKGRNKKPPKTQAAPKPYGSVSNPVRPHGSCACGSLVPCLRRI
jgi:hypothetical protein